MNFIILAGLLVLATLTAGDYAGKFEDFNVDEVIQNRDLLNSYVNCMLEKEPCSPEGQSLKDTFLEGIQDKCMKCTPKQLELLQKGLSHLIQNEPAYWNQLLAKFDPKGELKFLYAKY